MDENHKNVMGFPQETDCINYQHISFHFALCNFIKIFYVSLIDITHLGLPKDSLLLLWLYQFYFATY